MSVVPTFLCFCYSQSSVGSPRHIWFFIVHNNINWIKCPKWNLLWFWKLNHWHTHCRSLANTSSAAGNMWTSASFLAEISVRSPRKLFIFIIYKNLLCIKVSKKYFIYFWKRKHWCELLTWGWGREGAEACTTSSVRAEAWQTLLGSCSIAFVTNRQPYVAEIHARRFSFNASRVQWTAL